MAKIVVGPVNRGLRTDVEPFNINNDNFPVLLNAYQWRGRIKRKRGTAPCTHLTYNFDSGASTITLNGSGNGNLITAFSLDTTLSIVPGSVILTNGGTDYTDPDEDGVLETGGLPAGTINYTTGNVSIAAEAGNALTAVFDYYPNLPVMGLERVVDSASTFPQVMAFDTIYSYLILATNPYTSHNVNFYKNPPTSGTYTQKSVDTENFWNGGDYQQFWSTNYQNAFWVTNGIDVPFTGGTIGMQFKSIVSATVTAGGPPATVSLNIIGHGLSVGDFLFINEVVTTTGINYQTGYVTTVTNLDNVVVTFPNATIATNGTGGIAQYLTNNSDATKDCIRWYDGDPTLTDKGWVNFCPPISNLAYSISDLPPAQYYLVNARMIIPFKDRLLFLGPVVQTSSGSPIYIPDAVIYSQNGTPYYTCSFTDTSSNYPFGSSSYNQILLPTNQTSVPFAFFEDSTGFGGFETAGTSTAITSVNTNEDVLIIGFADRQTRFVYTSNDILPFQFYTIDTEYPTSSTFSVINMGNEVFTSGVRGIIITSQTNAKRLDLQIPDEVFQFELSNNGLERVTAARDYINEWVYLSYPDNEQTDVFPTRTLQYNYRDNSWAIFEEAYTTYGSFQKATGYTWSTIGDIFPTWESWNEPWNSGTTTLDQPEVIAGNAQGYVVFRDEGTNEANSIEIKNISFVSTITGATQANPCVLTSTNSFVPGQKLTISGVSGMTQLNGNTYDVVSTTSTTITIQVDSTLFGAYTMGGTATPISQIYCPNHCLKTGIDPLNSNYIVIDNCLGTISSQVNLKVFGIRYVDNDNFNLSTTLTSATYLGAGTAKRIYNPFIQSKQFPVSWQDGRKTRLGMQQYLLTTTSNGAITLLIYLSQNAANPYNQSLIVPDPGTVNSSLIYSTLLYTCPESTNLGLTAANVNLQMPTASQQNQIWHRVNTSLIGDSVQVGFTLSQEQLEDADFTYQFKEIEIHGFIIEVNASQLLA